MFGYDPEVPAGYQDADIEMLELAQAISDPNSWKCEYRSCTSEVFEMGVCHRHRMQELREMEAARRY